MRNRTCKFFSPDKTNAQEHGLQPGELWPFDQLMDAPCCMNPRMGATDMPVPCAFVGDDQSNCPGYQEEPQKIHEVWRATREHTTHGEGKFILVSLIEERVGLGVQALVIHRSETNEPFGESILTQGTLTTFLSSRLGDKTYATAAAELHDYLQQHGGTQTWQRVPALETHTTHRSYYAHVLTLAEREQARRKPQVPIVLGEMS